MSTKYKQVSPLHWVIEKNQTNLAHLYQYYENELQFRKIPYTGNPLFRSYGEMVQCIRWPGRHAMSPSSTTGGVLQTELVLMYKARSGVGVQTSP